MTREEAIECLSERVSIGKMCGQSCMVGFGVNIDTLDEAFDMAISALRQQKTMTDSHQMTNADSIRAMNDEELAEFIKHIKVRAAFCKAVKNNNAFEELCSTEWLQQPVEEDDHA